MAKKSLNGWSMFTAWLKKLKRFPTEYEPGVCKGLGYWLNIPPWTCRIAFLIALWFYFFPAAAIYFALWCLLPTWEEIPADYDRRTGH